MAGTENISVVLADDHAVVRSALRLMLEREPDIEVTSEEDIFPVLQVTASSATINELSRHPLVKGILPTPKFGVSG